jgi:transposase
MAETQKTFQQAATELNVSVSTLKRWVKDFAPFLSPSGPVSGDGSSRRLSEEDLTVLRRVKE